MEDTDEPTGHAETLIELVRQVASLNERVRALEHQNKTVQWFKPETIHKVDEFEITTIREL